MKWQLLHKACWAGDAEEVARLLDAGADPNQIAPTTWRQTPLGRTLEFRITHPKHEGHLAVVRLLLDRGADPTTRSTYLDMTPYELASFAGFEAAVDLLRAFPTATPHPSGMTELWVAAASRVPYAETVRRLASRENINATWRSATPLMMAAGHAGNWQVADLLLEAGADPAAGVSILHACCDWHLQHLVPAIQYLADNGWSVNARDAGGQTALHKAAFLGYASAVRKLLARGSDASAKDAAGLTPLDVARRANKAAAVRLLQGGG